MLDYDYSGSNTRFVLLIYVSVQCIHVIFCTFPSVMLNWQHDNHIPQYPNTSKITQLLRLNGTKPNDSKTQSSTQYWLLSAPICQLYPGTLNVLIRRIIKHISALNQINPIPATPMPIWCLWVENTFFTFHTMCQFIGAPKCEKTSNVMQRYWYLITP